MYIENYFPVDIKVKESSENAKEVILIRQKTHKSRWLGLEKNEADYNEYEPEKWFVFFQDVATLYNNNNNDNIILYIAHGSEHPAALYNLLVSE